MGDNFFYRQKKRQERLEAKRRAAVRRRIRTIATVFTFAFLFITVISANAVIAKAGEGYEKNYEKYYSSVMVERGETVLQIASEHMTPGYDAVEELVDEIAFINGLDETYTIKSGTVLMVPYYAEN